MTQSETHQRKANIPASFSLTQNDKQNLWFVYQIHHAKNDKLNPGGVGKEATTSRRK